jgi:hypothetical protein
LYLSPLLSVHLFCPIKNIACHLTGMV